MTFSFCLPFFLGVFGYVKQDSDVKKIFFTPYLFNFGPEDLLHPLKSQKKSFSKNSHVGTLNLTFDPTKTIKKTKLKSDPAGLRKCPKGAV